MKWLNLWILLALCLALPLGAQGEAYVPLAQLKAQVPLVWEGEYVNDQGEQVMANASVVLPQGDEMPILQLQKRATPRTWRDKTEQNGYHDFFYFTGRGNFRWEWKDNPYNSDPQYGQAQNNPMTPAEAWDLASGQIAARYGIETTCLGITTLGILYETHKDRSRGKAVSDMGWYEFVCGQVLSGVPMVCPSAGTAEVITPQDFRLDLDIYEVLETMEADVLLLPWARIEEILKEGIRQKQVDPVFALRLGYVPSQEGEKAESRPVWMVTGWPMADAGRALTPEERPIFAQQAFGPTFFIDARTGEIMDMWF